MATSSINISIKSQHKIGMGTASLQTWTRQQSLKKGMSSLLACWALAVATILIPIVHFVSVPLLLAVGPLIAYAIFKLHNGTTDLVEIKGVCSNCDTPLQVSRQTASWPIFLACSTCASELSLSPTLPNDR